MNLFDKDFFPTPDDVIRVMVTPYADQLSRATILEPSAGNGAIAEFIRNKGIDTEFHTKAGFVRHYTATADKSRIYTIEKNPELQMILREKGFRVIADDFLSFRPDTRFSLILMNPPFHSGAEHLLHAWDILAEGDIACLLNSETLRNPCTRNRQLLKRIIDEHGSVEDLGPCFRTAENPTDVEVSLVRLHKDSAPDDDRFRLDPDAFAKDAMPDFGDIAASGDAVMQSSRLDAYIRAWEMAKAAAVNYIKSREILGLYLNSFLPRAASCLLNSVEKSLDTSCGSPTRMEDAYNTFVSEGKSAAWRAIFAQLGMHKYMTTSLQKKMDELQQAQGDFGLTKENIMNLFRLVMDNIGILMDQSVADVYDRMTRYFPGNTSCNEGWKTNKRFSCNRKVILPGLVEPGWSWSGLSVQKYRLNYGSDCFLDDIDKAMCWLSGRQFESLTGQMEGPAGMIDSPQDMTLAMAVKNIRVGDQGWHECAFFRVKAFKKGTVHIEFKDEALWAKFNLTVNQEKNRLGNGEAA